MTDQEIMEQIQYTMIEPPNGGQSWPSLLWTRDEVINYLNENQDRFIKLTHIRLETTSIAVVVGTSRYSLPADWVATVRVYWTPTTGQRKELTRSDSWEADHGIPTWSLTQGIPKLYMDGDTPTLTLQIAPVPSVPGTLEVRYVANCDAVNGNGASMTVMDEFVPTVKYGAMADMFSKVGRAHDPTRAQYCDQRYQLGVQVAQALLKGFKD